MNRTLRRTLPELLLMAAVAVAIALASPHATSWHYFHDAAGLLFSRAAGDTVGLDVYLTHPEFQFGPIAIVAAEPFTFGPAWVGHHAVLVVGTALGLAALAAVRMMDPGARADSIAVRAIGAAALAVTWSDVAVRTAHLDDALALSATAVACAAIGRVRPHLATVALIIAVAAKPWAVVLAPLAGIPPGRHRHLRPLVVVVGAATTWLPFAIDEPSTLAAAGSFRIANAPASALRALGVTDPSTPGWVRPAQFAVGILLVAFVCARGRWRAGVMAGLASRLLLDPGAHHYYAVGAVMGVLVWEGWARPGRVPLWTVLTAVALEVTPEALQPAAFAGVVRLGLLAGLLALAVGGRARPGAGPAGATA